MKKLSLIFALLLAFTLIFTACSDNTVAESENVTDNIVDNTISDEITEETPVIPEVVNVAALKGPTGMGLIKFIEDSFAVSEAPYVFDFKLESAADAITPKLIKGEIDIAAVPANLASVLYNRTNGGVVVLNINTLGVLYIVENGDTVSSVEHLRGKTIYASGQGNTPEYALNYMLESYGLVPGTDVFIEFKTEHSECLAAILGEPNAVAMLPQPFVTSAIMQNENVRIALDINKEWENATGKRHVTGVTVARKEFVEAHPEAVKAFLDGHKTSSEYVNTNVDDAATLMEKHGLFKAAIAKSAIPYCSISCIYGEEMKSILSEYLTILSGQNIKALGGALPADDFYYIAE